MFLVRGGGSNHQGIFQAQRRPRCHEHHHPGAPVLLLVASSAPLLEPFVDCTLSGARVASLQRREIRARNDVLRGSISPQPSPTHHHTTRNPLPRRHGLGLTTLPSVFGSWACARRRKLTTRKTARREVDGTRKVKTKEIAVVCTIIIGRFEKASHLTHNQEVHPREWPVNRTRLTPSHHGCSGEVRKSRCRGRGKVPGLGCQLRRGERDADGASIEPR